ncbi:MAG: hypothetical protein JWN03_8924 [Nocardia sp.]|uniref:VOC family protein n=1 Tax=Nocardia sp. TaxID=1821 RepID=UPI00262528E7|nr:VOC family protein [Nocardia sp.]MCU1648649.1 hypothetical protein [Nocardia sp.]
MQKIVTNLWFDTEAEEAAQFYCSLFEDSKIIEIQPYTEAGPGEAGSTLLVEFQLNGQQFTAINGGGDFHYTHAMSLLVNCDDQEEVDRLWAALLTDGGQEVQCGWINDKYGVPWQIFPVEATEFIAGPDREARTRATRALYTMKKIEVAKLRDAYAGKTV